MNSKVCRSSSLDLRSQLDFLNGYHLRFQHLDWLRESDRVTQAFAYTYLEEGQIVAMLSTANDNPTVTWIRYFVARRSNDYKKAFHALLNAAKQDLQIKGITKLYALGTSEWFERMLLTNDFRPYTEIVQYNTLLDEIISKHINKKPAISNISHLNNDFTMRPMSSEDLGVVHQIDQSSFPPVWQISYKSIQECFNRSSYRTIVSHNNQPVAFLLSETIFDIQHLSRIAVHPSHRQYKIATALLANMIDYARTKYITHLTTNTSKDNLPANNLYAHFGFLDTNETLTVYSLFLD